MKALILAAGYGTRPILSPIGSEKGFALCAQALKRIRI